MSSFNIEDESKMQALGCSLADKIDRGMVVFLSGELGSGKTTLVKGILAGFGHQGLVTSPTYTLVETYQLSDYQISHFDLYRVQSANELETIGIRDMITPESISLIEWPEHGSGFLPEPHLIISIDYLKSGRQVVVE